MKILKLFICALVLWNNGLLADSQGPTDVLALQKKFVAQMSGYEPWENVHLRSRFEESELIHARAIIRNFITELELQPLSQTFSYQNPKSTANRENIYTLLESTTGSDEYVIIGGHYDSVRDSPGANDNASGMAVALGVAAELSQLDSRSKNFIFVFMDAEECLSACIVGAARFAKKVSDEAKVVHSVHTIDQMGWDSDGDRAIEMESASDYLFNLYQRVNERSERKVNLHRTTTYAEHAAFRKYFPDSTGITEEFKNGDTTPHYHSKQDTYETINFDYMEHITHFLSEVMAEIAK